ncbi:MAG TPA: hypothetical protein VLS49_14715 [Usitatibacter sp.]|nr:hypothetical protein [Usitatibacter sp.]
MDTGNACHGTAVRGVRMAMAVLGTVLATAAWAQIPGEKSVHGTVVRVGLAPLEQIEALPAGRPERTMHMSHAAYERDHLVVALADARDGHAVQHANVVATVSRMGMGEERRALERMEEYGTTSWGGYFNLRSPGPYLIHVEVTRPGQRGPIVAEFVYRNH